MFLFAKSHRNMNISMEIIVVYVMLLAAVLPAPAIRAYTTRSYQTTFNQETLQTTLSAIEERLKNLDKLYRRSNMLEHHARRLELLEAKIERFESILTSHLDKIEGNMSMHNFKDDIAKDQVQRKIDAVYERMHNKLFHVEMKIDSGERKITEKLDAVLQRFEHLEEVCSVRVEEEANVVLAVVDKIKSLNVDILDTSKSGNELILRAVNSTNEICQQVCDVEKSHAKMVKLEAIVNASRYEQQNAMRSLIVQVGRLGGKNNIADSGTQYAHAELSNISRQIDDKFDKLLHQQTIFLDSCHRIQNDEPQLESKIGEILEKIIDIFEKESTIEIKDIQNIEQLIKNHDASIRRSLYTTSHNMGVLMQKGNEYKDEVKQEVLGVKQLVQELTGIIRDQYVSGNLTKDHLLNSLHTLRNDLGRIDLSASQVQEVLGGIRSAIQEYALNVTWQRAIDKNDVSQIREQIQDVRLKLDAISGNTNQLLQKTINELLNKIQPTVTTVKPTANADDFDLAGAILDVFGPPPLNANNSSINISDSNSPIGNSTILTTADNDNTPPEDEVFDFDLRTVSEDFTSNETKTADNKSKIEDSNDDNVASNFTISELRGISNDEDN